MGYSTSMNNNDNAAGSITTKITDQTFSDFISKGYTFVDFWAEWCYPCIQMGPTFESLATEYKDKIKFGKLNTDENPITSMQQQITSIPRFMLFKDGEKIGEITGAVPRPKFNELLDTVTQ